MAIITIPDSIAAQLEERLGSKRSTDEVAARALEDWLDLTDGRGQRGGALALLLDEVGASARDEMALPGQEELGDWLRLLQNVPGIRSEAG